MNKLWIARALLFLPMTVNAQDKTRILLSERSNVSSAEVGKELDHHCPAVVITGHSTKAAYALEAIDTHDGPGRNLFGLFSMAVLGGR